MYKPQVGGRLPQTTHPTDPAESAQEVDDQARGCGEQISSLLHDLRPSAARHAVYYKVVASSLIELVFAYNFAVQCDLNRGGTGCWLRGAVPC